MKRKFDQISPNSVPSVRPTDQKFYTKISTEKNYNSVIDFLKDLSSSTSKLSSEKLFEGVKIFQFFFQSRLLLVRPLHVEGGSKLSLSNEVKSENQVKLENWVLGNYWKFVNMVVESLVNFSSKEKGLYKTCVGVILKLTKLEYFYYSINCLSNENVKNKKKDDSFTRNLRKLQSERYDSIVSSNSFCKMIRFLVFFDPLKYSIQNKTTSQIPKEKRINSLSKRIVQIVNYLRNSVLVYDDVKYLCFTVLKKILVKVENGSIMEKLNFNNVVGLVDKLSFDVGNSTSYLRTVDISEEKKEEESLKQNKKKKRKKTVVFRFPRYLDFADDQSSEQEKTEQETIKKKVFQEFWISFLLLKKFPLYLYKIVLIRLEKHIIPFFKNPLLLSGFIHSSFSKGGHIALLSIKSLFLMMTQYGMTFEKYYETLYSMVSNDIMNLSYRDEFLRLVFASLCSTKIPEYIVASFVKKFARISLSSTPQSCLYIITLVYNLIKRNKGLICLVHRVEKQKEMKKDLELFKNVLFIEKEEEKEESKKEKEIEVLEVFRGVDQFDFKETDLSKTKAMDSCLWEFELFENHYLVDVSNKVAKFKYLVKRGCTRSFNLEENCAIDYDALFQQSLKSREEIIPNYYIQNKFFDIDLKSSNNVGEKKDK